MPKPFTLTDAERAKLGTIAYNRTFSARDWVEYGLTPGLFKRAMKAEVIEQVSRAQYAPTLSGWALIEGKQMNL